MSDNYDMDKDAYVKQLETENAALKQRCAVLAKRIEMLEKRLQALEERHQKLERLLGMNSRHSSQPPSSDLPGVVVSLPPRRRKKRGARKGRPPHWRALLPADSPPFR